jgi:G:T/U-mismatch repair DNA glycosylase
MTTKHQFSKLDFYVPTWNLKYLFLGTFNPDYSEEVRYYYGRTRNQFWKLLSSVFHEDFDPNKPDFFDLLVKHEIGCIDMIHSVTSDSNITGNADSILFKKKATRKYNTQKINDLIKRNSNLKIYSTWGNGPKLNEWCKELKKIDKEFISLKSPSMAARVPAGTNKFNYMLENWSNEIKI